MAGHTLVMLRRLLPVATPLSRPSLTWRLENAWPMGCERSWLGVARLSTAERQHRAEVGLSEARINDDSRETDLSGARPFEDIPGPPGLPLVGSLFSMFKQSGGMKTQSNIHEYFYRNQKKYGSIYRENILQTSTVLLSDPDLVKELVRQAPKYPIQGALIPLQLAEKYGFMWKGLLLADGEEWHRKRVVANRHMLRPRTVAAYTDNVNSVLDDLLPLFDGRLLASGEAPDLAGQLYQWSFESACLILFEQRLGALADNPPSDVAEFIQNAHDNLLHIERLMRMPVNVARVLNLPVWRKMTTGLSASFKKGTSLIEQRLEAMEKEKEADHAGLLATLVSQGRFSSDDITGLLMDLMGGSVDTTSNTAQWSFYLLAQNPDKQAALFEELAASLPPDGVPDEATLRDLPLIKATVRETLRMMPTAPLLPRAMSEDIVLGGYKIPKGVTVLINLWAMRDDPTLYEDPTHFRPERWLRGSDEAERIHPFASLPFGFGTRGCIGRRVAELELYLLLARVIHKYRVELVEASRPVEPIVRLILLPKQALRLRFIPRRP